MRAKSKHILFDVFLLTIIITLLLTSLPAFPIVRQVDASAESLNTGVWVLSEVEDWQLPETLNQDGLVREYGSMRETLTCNYRHAQGALHWLLDLVDEGESSQLTMGVAYSGIPGKIVPGQPLTIGIQLTSSFYYPGEISPEDIVSSFRPPAVTLISLPDRNWTSSEYDYGSRTNDTFAFYPPDLTGNGQASRSVTLTGTVRPGYFPGDSIIFTVTIGEIINEHQTTEVIAQTTYTYQWQEDPPPAETAVPGATSIELSGIVRGIDDKPLPRLLIEVNAFYDVDRFMWEDGFPDQKVLLTSDLKGAFACSIPIPPDIKNAVSLVITATLRSTLPHDQTAFFLADYQDPAAKNDIRVSTLLQVDPHDPSYAGTDSIVVSRALLFQNLEDPKGAHLSENDDGVPEPMHTNLSDASKLGGYSYLYRVLWDALAFGGGILEELPALLYSPADEPLRIDCNYAPDDTNSAPRSHYDFTANTIRLASTDCKFDDNSRFVALHEFGHFFDTATNYAVSGQWTHRCDWSSKISAGDSNHGGYLNKDTADSFIEGFAMWYAVICQSFRKDENPMMAGPWYLAEPADWVAWKNNGVNEDISMGALLARATMLFEDVPTFWRKILRPNLTDFSAYYDAMITCLGSNSLESQILRDAALAAGLFKMPFGNNQYDPGEPFLDANGNGKYDSPELFGDLMYAFDPQMQQIDPSKPLLPFDPKTAVAGQVSDNLRQRKTVQYLANSFINLTGETVQALKVTIRPDDSVPYAYLLATPEQKVYVGLPTADRTGQVEIAVPGGRTIYTGDLSTLQNQVKATLGQAVPLAQITVSAADLAPAGTVSAPTGGDATASGVLVMTKVSNQQAADIASQYNGDVDSLTAADLARSLTGGSEGETSSAAASLNNDESDDKSDGGADGFFSGDLPFFLLRIRIFLAGLSFLTRLLLVVIIAVIVWGLIFLSKHRRHHTAATSKNQGIFCPACGQPLTESAKFCRNCGHRLKS